MKQIIQSSLILLLVGALAAPGRAQTAADTNSVPADAAVAQLDRAHAELFSVLQWSAGTERQMAAQPDSPPAAELPQAVAAAQAGHAAKQAELERLTQQLAELRAAVDADNASPKNLAEQIHDLEARLTALRAELAKLAREEAELMRRLSESAKAGGLSRGVAAGERKSLVIFVNQNLVAPLDKAYFQGRQVQFRGGGTGVEISAKQSGVPLGQALASGGWLAEALRKADNDKIFAALVIAPDSISSYYALVKELKHRKLLHTWDTWDGQSITFSNGGSAGSGKGTVTVY